ncbi:MULTISPECIES: hypothetical protein [unclassified Caulobacter]|uniref:hypothetical protein n=1 Tax=unclassified Caulobacter TaxID=2648921 RepID=UPI0007809E79|nr:MULTISPECIES: hypothetical protein [unclassified Caulobacter]AZS22432.1 hypothetical protein CSW63_18405 [Caulobacter sp. FWC26]
MLIYVLFVPILFFTERSVLLTFLRYSTAPVDVETVQARFGLVALPRTALLLLVPISGIAARLVGAGSDWETGIMVLTMLIWLVVTLRDGWVAIRKPSA